MRIRNWTKFQHYKKRQPPWIRLYRELLEDPDWMNQEDEGKALLCELWMVASDTVDGSLPAIDALAWRLRRSIEGLTIGLSAINEKFIEGASEVLAECKRLATPEQSRDRAETEGEERQRPIARAPITATDLSLPNGHEIDIERNEVDAEESHLLRLLVSLQTSGSDVQALCDDIGRESKRAPFNAHRALVGGKSGIPRTSDGLTVRRRLIDALEARQRAQDSPRISDANRETLENIRKVGDRMRQQRGEAPREITG